MDYNKWESHDGNLINISDMSDEHIKNCVELIKRSYPNVKKKYEYLPTLQKMKLTSTWVTEHGHKYLKIFYKEIHKRSGTICAI